MPDASLTRETPKSRQIRTSLDTCSKAAAEAMRTVCTTPCTICTPLPELPWVFVENVGGRVVAELEVDALFAVIDDAVQVCIEHAIAEAVGPRVGAARRRGRGELIDLHEALDERVGGVYFQHAVGARPVLKRAPDAVLRLLRAARPGDPDAEEQAQKRQTMGFHGRCVMRDKSEATDAVNVMRDTNEVTDAVNVKRDLSSERWCLVITLGRVLLSV